MLLRPTRSAGPFVRHLAGGDASEVVAKLSRLLVVVAVARPLDPAAIGRAAAAMACSDILKALTEEAVGDEEVAGALGGEAQAVGRGHGAAPAREGSAYSSWRRTQLIVPASLRPSGVMSRYMKAVSTSSLPRA